MNESMIFRVIGWRYARMRNHPDFPGRDFGELQLSLPCYCTADTELLLTYDGLEDPDAPMIIFIEDIDNPGMMFFKWEDSTYYGRCQDVYHPSYKIYGNLRAQCLITDISSV